jgi:hypothetical protein
VVGAGVADGAAVDGAGVRGVVCDCDGVAAPGAADGDAFGDPPQPLQAVSIRPATAAAAKRRNGSQMFIGAPGEVELTADRPVRLSFHPSGPRHRGCVVLLEGPSLSAPLPVRGPVIYLSPSGAPAARARGTPGWPATVRPRHTTPSLERMNQSLYACAPTAPHAAIPNYGATRQRYAVGSRRLKDNLRGCSCTAVGWGCRRGCS